MSPSATSPSSLLSDQLTRAAEWLTGGRRFGLATLVEAEGSAPFAAGVVMLIADDGSVEGSLTGGCIESEVVQVMTEMLAGDGVGRVLTFGIADELAQSAGLMCGGTVHIFLQVPREGERCALAAAFQAAAQGRSVAVATLLDGSSAGAVLTLVEGVVHGSLGAGALLDRNVDRELRGALHTAGSRVRRYGADGATLGDELRVHIHSYLPAPRLLVVGATDYAAALATVARTLGYAVTITDARPVFAASVRFSRAAQTVVGWPGEVIAGVTLGERDAAVVLTHVERFDEPALLAILDTECGYVGALGSRRTTADRRRRLVARGVPESALDRIHAPCGLDIGAVTPEEVAISIMAEVIAVRDARTGGPLREASGAIRGRQALVASGPPASGLDPSA